MHLEFMESICGAGAFSDRVGSNEPVLLTRGLTLDHIGPKSLGTAVMGCNVGGRLTGGSRTVTKKHSGMAAAG